MSSVKYETPKLPDDAGKLCDFSDDGFKTVHADVLHGWHHEWLTEDHTTASSRTLTTPKRRPLDVAVEVQQ